MDILHTQPKIVKYKCAWGVRFLGSVKYIIGTIVYDY